MTRRVLKNSCKYIIAACGMAAIILCGILIPYTTTSATVYKDTAAINTITDTIENEQFSTSSTATAPTLTIQVPGNDISYLDAIHIEYIQGIYAIDCYIGINLNTNKIIFSVFISDDEYYIYTEQHFTDILPNLQNSVSFAFYSSSTVLTYAAIINERVFSGSVSGMTIDNYAIRQLTIDKINIPVNISEFSTLRTLGYGLTTFTFINRLYIIGQSGGTYEEGRAAGYLEGADDFENFSGWEWLKAGISLAGTILTIEIAPDIYLGYFAAIPLIFGVVLFVLKIGGVS